MRFVEKDDTPSKTVGPLTQKRKWGTYPAPQNGQPDQSPVYITEEMEKQLLAEDKAWALEPPRGLKTCIDSQEEK